MVAGILSSLATDEMNLFFGDDALDFALRSDMDFRNLDKLCVYLEGLVVALESPGNGENLLPPPFKRLRMAAFRFAAVLFDNPRVYLA